jgi:hypothetical protein
MRGAGSSVLLRRMGAARLLLASMLLAILITAALAAALAAFSSRALPQAVRSQLTTMPAPVVTVNGQFGAAQAVRDNTVITARLRSAFRPAPVRISRARWSDALGLPSDGGPVIPIVQAATMDGLTSHAGLVRGHWPTAPQPGQPAGAAVPLSVATRLHLSVGQRLVLPDRDAGGRVALRLTGVFRPRDPHSLYWGLDLIGVSGVKVSEGFVTYGPLIVAPGAFGAHLPVAQASWLAQPVLAGLPSGQLTSVAGRLASTQTQLAHPGPLGTLAVASNIPAQLRGIAANLVVARSLLTISVLQLLLLALVAIALSARLLASEREEESALLSARGGTRWQLVRLTVAEAVLLTAVAAAAGALVGGWLAGPLAHSGPLRQLDLSGLSWPGSVWWTAAGILVVCTAIMLWPAVRPAGPGATRARRGRQARLAAASQAGGDLAIVALGAIAVWQLHGYSAVARSASGSLAVDPVLVAAPAIALAGAAMIPLRLLPLLATAADKLAGHTRQLTGALASWQISRRPLRQSGPVLLVILAVAAGTLALAQHATWRQAAGDQAAFSVGAGARVDLSKPAPVGQVAPVQHAFGATAAMAVARFDGGLSGQVIALNSRTAPAVALMRPDLSPQPVPALWRRLRAPTLGLVLPGHPDRLALTARLTGKGLAPTAVTMTIQDAAGVAYTLPAGRLPADGHPHQLIAALSGSGQASYPLRLLGVTFSYQLPAVPAPPFGSAARKRQAALTTKRVTARTATAVLSGLAVAPAASGPFGQPFVTGAALRSWSAGGASADLNNPKATGTVPIVTDWSPAAGAGKLTYRPGDGYLIQQSGEPPLAISGQVTVTAPDPGQTIPGIATKSFLSGAATSAGKIVIAGTGSASVPVKIVATVRDFPTDVPGGLLIVDQAAIQNYLASRSDPQLPVTQWWLRAGGKQAGAVPSAQLPPGAAVHTQSAAAAALRDNPLSAAPQQAVLAIAVAAALLAILGFCVSVAASVRERRTMSALLAALGVSRAAQARQLCLEELLLSLPAAVAGLLLGVGVAHLLVPAVTLTAQATAPVPSAVVVLPLGWAAGLALLITAIPALIAAATVASRPDPAAQLRAAEAT